MNVNLLSPTKNENGFSYNVRFRENIPFKKNAKVYLNYASFSRESEVTFTEDQTITLSALQMLPDVLPQTPFTAANSPATLSITIPKINAATKELGYTFNQLQSVIETGLDSLCSQNQLKAYKAFGEEAAEDLKEKDVGMGFYIDANANDVVQSIPFEGDVNNERDAGSDANNDYFKNSASGTTGTNTFGYDNYSLSDTHYFHPFVQCDDEATISYVECHVNKSVNDLTGAVTFGLYSKEYAGNAGDASADRTQGTGATTGSTNSNPKVIVANTTISSGDANFATATLAAFITVEVTPLAAKGVNRNQNNNSTIIRIAKSAVANASDISSWTGINTNIQGMRQIHRVNNTNLTGSADESVKLVLQTYYTSEDGNLHTSARKLYFRLINVSQSHSLVDPQNIIYDSKRHNFFIPMAFFTGQAVAGTDAKKTDIVNSRIPFNVIVSAQEQNEGFSTILYNGFDKSQGTAGAPASIMMNYKLNYSAELAKYVGESISTNLYPNTCETRMEYIHIKNFRLDWLNDSYAILIKNLPIRNFKNNGNESNGGFGKAILANVPTPFKDTVEQTLDNRKILTGIFQPSYPVILELNNPSSFELNNFDVSIINIRDETEVDSLLKSNVSFTIQ